MVFVWLPSRQYLVHDSNKDILSYNSLLHAQLSDTSSGGSLDTNAVIM